MDEREQDKENDCSSVPTLGLGSCACVFLQDGWIF